MWLLEAVNVFGFATSRVKECKGVLWPLLLGSVDWGFQVLGVGLKNVLGRVEKCRILRFEAGDLGVSRRRGPMQRASKGKVGGHSVLEWLLGTEIETHH